MTSAKNPKKLSELKANYTGIQTAKDKIWSEVLPSLDNDFQTFLQDTLAEAQSLFNKKKNENGGKTSGRKRASQQDAETERGSIASSTADESFPVLLPQTPKARKATRARTAAKAAAVAEANAELTMTDSDVTATGRPRRGAARVAQQQITVTSKDKLNSKKRRPTDMSTTSSNSSLMSTTSSTASLSKKMQTVKIDSKVQIKETFDETVEPEEKKRRVTRSTDSVQSSGDPEVVTGPIEVQVEEKNPPSRKTRSGRNSAHPQPKVSLENVQEPVEDVDEEATVNNETTVKEDVTIKSSEGSDDNNDGTTISENQEEDPAMDVVEEVGCSEPAAAATQAIEKSPEKSPPVAASPPKRLTRSVSTNQPVSPQQQLTPSPEKVAVPTMDATYVKEDSPPTKPKRTTRSKSQKVEAEPEEVVEEAMEEDQAESSEDVTPMEMAEEAEVVSPATVKKKPLDAAKVDVGKSNDNEPDEAPEPAGMDATYVKENVTEEKSERPRRMTRSVSTQKLDEKPPTVATEAVARPGPRRMTRSISAQRLPVEQPKGEKHLAAMQQPAKPLLSPKIRVTHPSQSEEDPASVTLEADQAIEATSAGKYATLPRPGNKTATGMKKAVSTAAISKPNHSAALLSGIKGVSTSNLITAAKLSANKMGGATRKFTPHTPTKPGVQAETNQSSTLINRLRSKVANMATPISPMRKPMTAGASASKASNIVTTSFMPANNPLSRPQRKAKPTAAEVAAQKEEELRKKKEKEEDALRRKEEIAEAKREAKRKENEARQKRVMQARQAQEASKVKHEKEKQDALKKAQALADERRRKEQQQREEEEKRRKVEAEQEAERKRKAAAEEAERKQRQQEEEERRKKALEEKAKKARQEAEARLKAKQEAEAKAKEERDAKLKEEIRQQKLKLAQLTQKATEEKVDLNSTYNKGGASVTLNKTYDAAANNYEITPARHELPPEILNDPDNYDIADLRSDEGTDDEDNPRKKPAKWTQGNVFRESIFKQAYYPPDVDTIFFLQDATVELAEIFSEKKRKFYQRTSSAVWDIAPMSHKYDNRI